jgi:hypothetical protein
MMLALDQAYLRGAEPPSHRHFREWPFFDLRKSFEILLVCISGVISPKAFHTRCNG